MISGTRAAVRDRAGHHGVVHTESEHPDAGGGAAADHDAARLPSIYTAADRPRGLNAYFAPGGEDDAK